MAQDMGAQIAAAQAAQRKMMGPVAFEYGGSAYDATALRTGRKGAGDLLLEGGDNAAYAGALQVTVNPTPDISREIEGQGCAYQGESYTVAEVPAAEVCFGVKVAQAVVIFRTPPPASATTETTQEAAAINQPQSAGKRKEY